MNARLAMGLFVLALIAGEARADMFCVQRGLANLGYQPGTVDGLFGSRTAGASGQFAADFSIELEPLNRENSADWCPVVSSVMNSPEGIARRFDVTSRPAGVLSDSRTQALWDAYKTAPACFEHPTYGAGTSFVLAEMDAQEVAAIDWRSPFTQAIGAPMCQISAPDFGRPPGPIPVVTLDEAYGERQLDVDVATDWFMKASTYVRLTGDPAARQALKQAVLDWARAGALGRGINVSWGNRPVDYQMMTAILALAAATAEVIPDLSESDKAVIGPWLNGLAARSAASRWKDRQDNKAYLKAYIGLVWGIMAGDDAAVQEAIDTFKLAIHDMRPDGSFPIDTQRSGMGIQYNAGSVSHLVMIAAALRQAYGIDLFAYEADGRTGHDAVDFVLRSIASPGETNSIYAIACPDGGDGWGDIDRPSLGFMDDTAFLLVYASMFPDAPASEEIAARLPAAALRAGLSERFGGAAACQFAPPTGNVFTGEPMIIEGLQPELPEPEFDVTSREALAHGTGQDFQINSLFHATIARAGAGRDKLDFNIRGNYNAGNGAVTRLAFTINPPIGAAPPDGLSACSMISTRTYDDNLHRLEIRFTGVGAVYSAPGADCAADLVPEPSRFMLRFLTENFRDVAIGMVDHGLVGSISHEGLRAWLVDVAEGRIEVRGAN